MTDPNDCFDIPVYFITWTTFGTWLPGDGRGWRKWRGGEQRPQPLLEDWCRDRLTGQPVILTGTQRGAVEAVCRRHCDIRGWRLAAVSVRSNHVHLVVAADAKAERVRDEFKAYATRALRKLDPGLIGGKVWSRGGFVEWIRTEEELEQVTIYLNEAQDRMGRGK
jgi:REP element-mobilizing transposase RayT